MWPRGYDARVRFARRYDFSCHHSRARIQSGHADPTIGKPTMGEAPLIPTVAILREIRERRQSVLELANSFGLSAHLSAKRPSNFEGVPGPRSMRGSVWDALLPLQDAALIEVSALPGGDPATTYVEASELLSRVQNVLGLSLTALLQEQMRVSMRVVPFHGVPDRPMKSADVFVLSPFTEDMTEIYKHTIVPAASLCRLSCARADDFFSGKIIMKEIWDAINGARLLLADCTGKNPNVFYETGLAHALGRPTILLTQNMEDMPFDLRHVRAITYTFSPKGIRSLEGKLVEAMTSVLRLPVAGNRSSEPGTNPQAEAAISRLEENLENVRANDSMMDRLRSLLVKINSSSIPADEKETEV